jgi:hypothetical protein
MAKPSAAKSDPALANRSSGRRGRASGSLSNTGWHSHHGKRLRRARTTCVRPRPSESTRRQSETASGQHKRLLEAEAYSSDRDDQQQDGQRDTSKVSKRARLRAPADLAGRKSRSSAPPVCSSNSAPSPTVTTRPPGISSPQCTSPLLSSGSIKDTLSTCADRR